MDALFKSVHHEYVKNAGFTYISHLILQRRNEEVISILKSVPPMKNIIDTTNQTLLYVATKYNNIPIIEHLMKSNCEINAQDIFGWTPLMIAAQSKDPRPVSMLLDYDADIFVENSSNQSALQIYLNMNYRRQHLQVLCKFFEKVNHSSRNNEEVYAKLKKAKCKLDILVHLRNPVVTKMFLDHRYHIEESESSHSVQNCMDLLYEENLKVLLQYGADVEERRTTFLDYFNNIIGKPKMSKIDLKKYELFLQLLMDLEFFDEDVPGFVRYLVLESTVEQLEIIIQSGINNYIKNEFDFELIAYVFGNQHPNILEFIIRQQINVHMRGVEEITALHLAVDSTLHEHVKYLLDNGADPNATDEYGDTPIFYVFDEERKWHYDESCILLLLKYGADIQHSNNDGRTFIEYVAYTDKCANIFAIIFAHLAMLNSQKVPIDETFTEFINLHKDLVDFYGTMCQQLERMKTHELCENLTYFMALTESVEFLSRRVRSLDLYTTEKAFFYRYYNLDEYHSYYTDILCDRVLSAYTLCNFRDRAINVIGDCIETLKPYYLVVEKICSYLSHEDWRRLSYPFQKTCQTEQFTHSL